MKKFILTAVAVMGTSVLMAGAAQAGGWGYGGGYSHHGPVGGYGMGYGGGYGGGYYGRPGYRPPVYRGGYGVPIYRPAPVVVAPAYPYPAYYGTSFGISTPNFGLFINK
jgi:hypothetical protein